MTTPSLDVFSLRDTVVDEYKRFATSFTTIHAADIREQVEAIYGEQRYWPEPLIQINPSYRRSTDVGSLADGGVLDATCADIFQVDGNPLTLCKHQEQAIALGDLDPSTYRRIFRAVHALAPATSEAPFQYIITTTSPPPADLVDDFVRMELAMRPAEKRFLGVDL